jgi:hypothetical protein
LEGNLPQVSDKESPVRFSIGLFLCYHLEYYMPSLVICIYFSKFVNFEKLRI